MNILKTTLHISIDLLSRHLPILGALILGLVLLVPGISYAQEVEIYGEPAAETQELEGSEELDVVQPDEMGSLEATTAG